jgi:multicomponent Na+:H+ antiporter subunit D
VIPNVLSNTPILLFLVPFLGGLLCALADWSRPRVAGPVATGTMLFTAALSIWAAYDVWTAGALVTDLGGWTQQEDMPWYLGIRWQIDSLSALLVVLVSVISAGVIASGHRSLRSELPSREPVYYACALLLISGLMGITLTADLFNLFVHLEVASLAGYALVAGGRKPAIRAAMDYLIIGTIGASMYLLGVGFIYAATGTLNMAEVATYLAAGDAGLSEIGLLLITVGLAVKMGLFPLHTWMPAAYATAPAAAGALMAPLATKVSAYALLRVLFWVVQPDALQQEQVVLAALTWVGAAGMIFGAVQAARQSDLWRLLAYSSVSQMGLIALGMGLADANSLTGAILHIANDAVMKGALFLAAAVILARFGVRQVDQLSCLRGAAPWMMGVFVIAGLSLIGIPPLCGFYGKWYVLSAAIDQQAWVFVAAIVLGSLATAVYIFRIFEQLFFKPADGDLAVAPGPKLNLLSSTSIALTVCIVLLGLITETMVSRVILPILPEGLSVVR